MGIFSGKGFGNAFGFVHVDTDTEYLVPFFDGTSTQLAKGVPVNPERPQIIKVPPGNYWLKRWVTYVKSGEISSQKDLSQEVDLKFEVKPGRPLFIGRYKTRQYSTSKATYYSFLSVEVDGRTINDMLKEHYPNFNIRDFDFLKSENKAGDG
ncbi:MAG: hypothetical protein AAF353_18545 [Pseudomonadota bacterium]